MMNNKVATYLIFLFVFLLTSLPCPPLLSDECDKSTNKVDCRLEQANTNAASAGLSVPEEEEIKTAEIALALMNALTSSMAFGSLGAPNNCPSSISYQIFIWTARLQSFFEIFWFRGFSARSAARKEIFQQEMKTEAGDYAQTLAYEYLVDENNDTADYYDKKYQYHLLVGAVYTGAGVLAALELMGVICPPTNNGISARIEEEPLTTTEEGNGDAEEAVKEEDARSNLEEGQQENLADNGKTSNRDDNTATPREVTTEENGFIDRSTPPTTVGGENDPYASYSNDPQTQKMLAKLDANAEPKSTRYCARYVNRAMSEAGMWPSGGKGNAIDYPKSLTKYGFTNIYTGSNGTYQATNAPVGSIIVYNSSHHAYGHIEVYDGSKYISDYRSPHPITKSTYGSFYTVAGIYVKVKKK